MHVDSCISPALGEACLDAFEARQHGRAGIVVTSDDGTRRAYRMQCERLGVELEDTGISGAGPGSGRIVIGAPASITGLSPHAIGRIGIVRNYAHLLGELRRKGGRPSGGMEEAPPAKP